MVELLKNLGNIIKAFKNGETIEVKHAFSGWKECPDFLDTLADVFIDKPAMGIVVTAMYPEFRIKHNPEYVPLTEKDFVERVRKNLPIDFIDKHGSILRMVQTCLAGVYVGWYNTISGGFIDYERLMKENYTFTNGDVCGKPKEQQ